MKILWLSLVLFISCLAQADEASKKLVIIGDSLTEGYGVEKSQAFPAQLEKILNKNEFNYKVINGGVSGSTTSSGMSRLNWFLKAKPDLIILALGANDGLRGIKVEKSQKNLEDFISKCQKEDIPVILAGMQLPPNYGKEYTSAFKKMFQEVANKYKVPQIPFLIEGVAGKPELNIEDGIHPNPKGHIIIAQNVFLYIKDYL